MSTHRFIADLVPLVLDSSENWWPRDLYRLALVSSEWLAHSRKRLYRHPNLRSFRACYLLSSTLRSNPALVPLVHTLDLCPVVGQGCTPLNAKETASLRHLLSLKLQSLTLGGELSINANRFLHTLAHPDAIEELKIIGNIPGGDSCSYVRTQKPSSLEWDEGIALKFPKLRKLRLSHLDLDLIFPSLPYQLSISDLSLDNVNIIGGYLHYLLNDSWSSLRHLDVVALSAAENTEHVNFLLGACRDTVESLHFEIQRDSRSEETLFESTSPPYPCLRKLSLDGVAMDPDMLTAIARTCPSLHDLCITGRNVTVTPQLWADVLSNRESFPELKRLTTPMGTCEPPYQHWRETARELVLGAAKAREVEVVCRKSFRS